MGRTAKQQRRASAAEMAGLIASALASDYRPTLSRPEQAADADLFDALMIVLGRPNRAWRGVRSAA